jgi:glutathione S-transferase
MAAARLALPPGAPRRVDVFGSKTRTPALRAMSGMGEGPLPVEGDMTLTQCGAIRLPVARRTARLGSAVCADGAGEEVLRRIRRDNRGLSSQAGTARLLMNVLPPDTRDAAVKGCNRAAMPGSDRRLTGLSALPGWKQSDDLMPGGPAGRAPPERRNP